MYLPGLLSETGRIRFRRVRFQTPNSVSFSGLTEFQGANSVSSFSLLFVCKGELTEFFAELTELAAKLSEAQWVLFSETVLSKQNSAGSDLVPGRGLYQIHCQSANTHGCKHRSGGRPINAGSPQVILAARQEINSTGPLGLHCDHGNLQAPEPPKIQSSSKVTKKWLLGDPP